MEDGAFDQREEQHLLDPVRRERLARRQVDIAQLGRPRHTEEMTLKLDASEIDKVLRNFDMRMSARQAAQPVSVQKLRVDAKLPVYATEGSAGADLFACFDLAEECRRIIHPGEWQVIPTGLAFEVPAGFEIQIRPRSGVALKWGVTVLNTPGTIDSDYRGEVGVILINHGRRHYNVNNGERIAQMVLAPVFQASFKEIQQVSATSRGAGGFGSTGVH